MNADGKDRGATPFVARAPLLRPAHAPIHADVLIHADWSGNAKASDRSKKRQCVRADRTGSTYRVGAPRRIDDADAWLEGLVAEARAGAAVVVGFDFVIGLPESYARLASIASFVDFVRVAPPSFFDLDEHVGSISLSQPFFPKNAGAWSTVTAPKGEKLLAVAKAIGVDRVHDLLRRCEHATESRNAACSLFITSGAKQVGRAAGFGWREVIRPLFARHSDIVNIWPFHGELHDLVRPGTLTLVETCPAETYAHLGIGGDSSKQNQAWRRHAGIPMLEVAGESIVVDQALEAAIADGFGRAKSGEDPFDALAGALGMVLIAVGRDSAPLPSSSIVREVEGWILGLDVA
jgi:hypothetical protein